MTSHKQVKNKLFYITKAGLSAFVFLPRESKRGCNHANAAPRQLQLCPRATPARRRRRPVVSVAEEIGGSAGLSAAGAFRARRFSRDPEGDSRRAEAAHGDWGGGRRR